MATATMDFFKHQESARRRTRWLVVYFGLAVLLITVAVYLAVLFGMGFGMGFIPLVGPVTDALKTQGEFGWQILWQPKLFFAVSGVTILVIAVTSLVKIHALAAGGRVVAMTLGGRKLDPQTNDLDERRLLNVVEEMAIASGVPVPEIYILAEEKGINAFAAGYTTSDAVIGATRGTVRLLDRAELQGVIAHEFSHILNADMRLNFRLIGLLHGILAIALIGRLLIEADSSRKKNDAAILPIFGFALLVVGSIGVFFGRLIKSAISRQREFLADAAAVQFTRYPDGLAGALKKIGGLPNGSRLGTPNAEEASHLLFSNGLRKNWFGLMSTHPPVEERIRRIDPHWDGKFLRLDLPQESLETMELPDPQVARDIAKILATPSAAAIVTAANSLNHVGAPTMVHVNYARELLATLPDEIKTAAHIPSGAEALVYALLLGEGEPLRARQVQELESQIAPEVLDQVRNLMVPATALGRDAKLPLVELALPALRQQSADEHARFKAVVQHLIESDREIDLFEYCLQRILLRHLGPHFGPPRKPTAHFYALKPVVTECAVLLSALAGLGHDAPEQEATAFEQGVRQLNLSPGQIRLLPFEECNLPQIDQALDKLALLSSPLKRVVLNACAHAVAADGAVQLKEAELLRAIADTLDCPMPPFVTQRGSS